MLISVGGGNSGIEDYLEKGKKKEREHTRDELDERLILDGNLHHTRQVIASMDTQAERYLHITLGFKEDHISPELLQSISDDFRTFSMNAYDTEEYDFFSEAHLPKIKTLLDKRTGELIERKPHIHIAIPKVNLLTGKRIDPFELVKDIQHHIDAFQEVTNEKYGLESPKMNLRTTFNSSSEIVSRHKGDIFIGQGKALKETAFNILMESKIQSLPDFSHALSQAGFEVKIRNAKSDDPYLNIKMSDHVGKGVNLKDLVFRSDFLAKSFSEKQNSLSTYDPKQYIDQSKSNYRATPKHHQDLKHWYEQKSHEVRYIKFRNRQQYKSLKQNDKLKFLDQKRAENYEQNQRISGDFDTVKLPYRASRNIIEGTVRQSTDYDGATNENLRKSDYYVERIKQHSGNIGSGTREHLARRHLRAIVTDLQQHRNDQGNPIVASVRERTSRSDVIRQIISDNLDRTEPDLTQIKKGIDSQQLLNQLHLTHGLITDKYPVSLNKEQEPRIQCGKRLLNVSDFMTKELNLSWKETRQYLIDEYQRQHGLEIKPVVDPAWQKQLQLEQQRQRHNQQSLKNELRHIYETEPSYLKKQSLISVAKMKKVLNDIQLNQQTIIERKLFLENTMLAPDTTVKSITGNLVSYNDKKLSSAGEYTFDVKLKVDNEIRVISDKRLKSIIEEGIKNQSIKVNDDVKITATSKQIKGDRPKITYTIEPISIVKSIEKENKIIEEQPTKKPSIPSQIKQLNEKVSGKQFLLSHPELKEQGALIKSSDKGDRIIINDKDMALSTVLEKVKGISSKKDIVKSLEDTYQQQVKFEEEKQSLTVNKETMKKVGEFLSNRPTLEDDKKKVHDIDLVIQPVIVPKLEIEKEAKKSYPPLEIDLKVKGMDIHFKRDEKTQHVIYSEKLNNQMTNMFVDKGDTIKVLDKKDTSLEVALLLAKEKYGHVLNIKGTEEYQNKLINIAAKKNIDIEFSDPVMNQKLIEMKEVMKVGNNIIQKGEQSNAVTKQPDLPSQKIEQPTKGISR